MESLKIFPSCENCPADHLKAKKKWAKKYNFLAICGFVFSFSISNLVIWIFLCTGTRKDTNMLNGPANLRKFHWRKHDKFYSKDLYFLCCKTLLNGIEICQDSYLSMCRLLNHGSYVLIWHVYFGLMKFLDMEDKLYWTSVALYSLVVPWKIIRYIPFCDSFRGNLYSLVVPWKIIIHITLSDSFKGILASIIEMLQYSKHNSHSVCHLVIIVVKIKTIHIYHAYKINIPQGLVQMFVCQQLESLVDL